MLDVLAQVPLFQALSQGEVSRLAEQGRHRHFPAGSHLMRQGDHAASLYILLEGQVRVERSHPELTQPVRLALLGPGEIVGEIGLLDEGPRTATVTAMKETEALELTAPVLAQVILEHPDVGTALLRVLSQRLRSTDELAEQMGRSNQQRALRTTLSGPASSLSQRRPEPSAEG